MDKAIMARKPGKPGKVQLALLQEMAGGTDVKRLKQERHTLTRRVHTLSIRSEWRGSRKWEESTVGSIVRNGWAEWVGAPITSIRITEAGRALVVQEALKNFQKNGSTSP